MKTSLFVLLVSLCVVFSSPVDDEIAKMVLETLDWDIDPCVDFYNFSCGGWMKKTEIPSDASRFDRAFFPISVNNELILKEIVTHKSEFPKINEYYQSCMDKAQIEIVDYEPLAPYLTNIDQIDNINDFLNVAGKLQMLGVSVLFSAYVERDAKNPEYNIAYFSQGGIALPDISLYQDQDMSIQYMQHVEKILSFIDGTNPGDADAVYALEKSLSENMLPNNELVDPFKTYNKLDISGLKKVAPGIPWDSFLSGLGYPSMTQVSVDVVEFFEKLEASLNSNQNGWKAYLKWHLVHSYVEQLSDKFVQENFNFFQKVLNGQPAPIPQWRTCVEATDSALGELTGYEYAQKAFPGSSREIAKEILQEIENSMEEDLNAIQWMDNETRVYAIEKLNGVANMIGFPDPPFKYDEVSIDAKRYLLNTIESVYHARKRRFDNVGKKSDRFHWDMTADTVNAYYDPTRNEMVFPAGIMQTPFFNHSFPLSMNYGGIGMVMGHELTHGFDNQGRDYNAVGLLTDWWTNVTSKKFDDKVQCVINQYDNFEVLPGVFVDGRLTQGENIADMGGIKNSFLAYRRIDPENADKPSIVKGLTNSQLFFVSFAQNWCSLIRPSRQRVLVKVDPHSPPRFRVLGPLMNFESFAKTFQCPVGSPMNPSKRCEVW